MRSERPTWARLAWLGLIVSGATLPAACSDEAGTTSAEEGPGGAFSTGAGGDAASGGVPGGIGGAAGFPASVGGTAGMGGLGASSGGALGAGGLPVGMAGAFGTGGLGMAGAFGTGGMPLGSGGDTSAGGSVESGGATGAGGGALAKFAGNITTRGQVRSDFIDYWDQITPENEGKWGSVEGVRDQMNWAGLDAAYNYAKQHGIPFKQHTFVWGAQQPGWVAGLPQDQQREEVEEWIRLFCERYPDTQMIDVVNEPPPHTTPPYMAALGGTGASGYDWIVQAFRWARQYCPRSILILNDYNTIEYGNDNRHFIDIVNRIRGAGAPIDAIGAQAHAAFNVPTDTVRGYIDQLAATGLPVYISEYDIDLADDARQRSVMESQFTMFWNHPSVKGVTLWGYVQGSTWLPNSGLMSGTGQMRPAMTWLMGYLSR